MLEEFPKPIEETDPEIAEFMRSICNGEAPYKIDFCAGEIHSTRTSTPASAEKKIGRNDPCTCNSGKKYKKCCGKK